MPSSVSVLGIDPGTRVVGWAILSKSGRSFQLLSCGAIRPDPALPYAARLAAIHAEIASVVREHAPTEAAIEEVFAGRNVKAALKIGEGRGVVLAALGAAGLEPASYPARRIKRAVTGNGAAEKQQVARMVAMQLGLREAPGPDDVTDACAVAITHLISRDLPN